jgi:glutamine transport system substrate-binding protein
MLKKKIVTTVLCLGGIWAMVGQPAVAQCDGLDKTAGETEKTLIVAADTAFVPFEFRRGDTHVGFDIDVWAAIAKLSNFKYKLRPIDFAGIVPGLQAHNLDVALAGIAITPKRQQAVDFSDPYYESGLSILVNKDNTSINAFSDLADKVVAAKSGTASVDFIRDANVEFIRRHQKETHLKLFPNIDNAYLELATGRADAVVHDTPNIQYYAHTVRKGNDVKVVASINTKEHYGIAFPKNSPLVPRVNKALACLKANGTYQTIYTKWFGEKL